MAGFDPQFVDQIKGFEGYRETPYWDHKQYTSGYGTKANSPDEVIDPAVAEQRLQTALQSAASHVDSVNPNLPVGARNALISLTFNAGPGWAQAGLGDLVRSNDLEGAKARLLEYNKASGEVNHGLVKRRAAEAAWFGGGAVPGGDASRQTAAGIPAPAPITLASATIPQQAAPIFAPAPQQAPQGGGQAPSLYSQMPAEQMGQPPPIFAPPRKPIDLSRLRAALQASGNRGFFNARG
jgi:GH24 family phage-related lysozyme (muramidase)